MFNNLVSKTTWLDRYCLDGEDFTDHLIRVAKRCSNSHAEFEEFKDVMEKGYFFPAGRTMFGAGQYNEDGEHKLLTFANCYILNFVPDSMEGIMNFAKDCAMTHKQGGGTGGDWSLIRPKGTLTSNAATATGPVSFMHIIDAETKAIESGSRRGANMASISIYHPDVLDFIKAKSWDAGVLTNMNMSVVVDDAFMNAMINDEDIYLHYPIFYENGTKVPESEWKIKEKKKAKEIWDEIILRAHENGEPGVLFIDNMNKYNPSNYLEKIVTTNPCVSGDTAISVLNYKGDVYFENISNLYELYSKFGKIPKVAAGISNDLKDKYCNEYVEAIPKHNGFKEVVRLDFSDGTNLICTPDHKLYTSDNGYIKASESKGIKIYGYKCGFFDGSYHQASSTVENVTPYGSRDVYDLEVPGYRNYWINNGILGMGGILSHNCGEALGGMIHTLPNAKGVCNLGSIMLHYLVENPFTAKARLNVEGLREAVKTAVRFLDNIIDINNYPLDDYRVYQQQLRTIGLGVSGLHNMLSMTLIPYDSPQAEIAVDKVMNEITYIAYMESIEIAKEKGMFPMCDPKQHADSLFIREHVNKDSRWMNVVEGILKYGIRNARIISVAPTGTLSLTYGNNCSSGIEPVIVLEGSRLIKLGGQSDDNLTKVSLIDYAYNEWIKLGKPNVPDGLFKTGLEISPDVHISILKIVASHVDASVSKTINLPSEYDLEDTKNVYLDCWKGGIKGCTIFRPNPLRKGLFNVEDSDTIVPRGEIDKVDDDLVGVKRKLMTGCGSMHVTCWYNTKGEMKEMFINKGSSGGCSCNLITGSRLTSLALRGGVKLQDIWDQYLSIPPCVAYTTRKAKYGDTSKGVSCFNAIYHAFKDVNISSTTPVETKKEEIEPKKEEIVVQDRTTCPSCKASMVALEGCFSCKECGYTKCG